MFAQRRDLPGQTVIGFLSRFRSRFKNRRPIPGLLQSGFHRRQPAHRVRRSGHALINQFLLQLQLRFQLRAFAPEFSEGNTVCIQLTTLLFPGCEQIRQKVPGGCQRVVGLSLGSVRPCPGVGQGDFESLDGLLQTPVFRARLGNRTDVALHAGTQFHDRTIIAIQVRAHCADLAFTAIDSGTQDLHGLALLRLRPTQLILRGTPAQYAGNAR